MVADIDIDIDIDMEIQFCERVGHGGWLIGPKLLRPEAFLDRERFEIQKWQWHQLLNCLFSKLDKWIDKKFS